jgi:hypothetical protein
MRDDAAEIRQRLNDGIEEVIGRYWPQWVKRGRLGFLTPQVKKGTSSFQVELDGAHKGRWYRFSAGIGGWGIELLYYGERGSIPSHKDEWNEAFRFAREFLGIARSTETDEQREALEARRAKDETERKKKQQAEDERIRRKRLARSLTAQEIVAESLPLQGTLAEAYLIGRGLPGVAEWPAPQDDLRFHPAVEYERDARWEGGRKVEPGPAFPALIGVVRDAGGAVTAIWQIFLDHALNPATEGKALVDNPKLGLGPAIGGAVRIGGDGPRIGASEGIESAIGAWALNGFAYPSWAMLSTSGLVAFEPPIFVDRIDYFPDGDLAQIDKAGRIRDPPGIVAARASAARVRPAGIKTVINDPSLHGDSLDVWKAISRRERRRDEG